VIAPRSARFRRCKRLRQAMTLSLVPAWLRSLLSCLDIMIEFAIGSGQRSAFSFQLSAVSFSSLLNAES
jgi:hypothetical protein